MYTLKIQDKTKAIMFSQVKKKIIFPAEYTEKQLRHSLLQPCFTGYLLKIKFVYVACVEIYNHDRLEYSTWSNHDTVSWNM